jgi:anti-sigma regulatory factor (Ser/Thr protein kinase)
MGMPAQQVSPPGDAAQWPYHSFLPLGALPGAVPCARLHTTAVLWEWGMEKLAQPAELAVSELVTNAVRASAKAHNARQAPGTPAGLPVVGLRLAADRLRLLVEVSDHDPGPPIPTAVDPERDGGRGLLLVEAVSERWGYYYPATDPVAPAGPAPAAGAPEFLAAAPLLPAAGEPGKIVWALLSPPYEQPPRPL